MSGSQFRRYTTLPYLLDMLHNKRLTLLDPSRWEDKNDAYFLKTYKKERELKSVLTMRVDNRSSQHRNESYLALY